jgi:hypothetical protein
MQGKGALMAKAQRGEVRLVRLSVDVDEATWRKLRDIAERERSQEQSGRASVKGIVQRLIAEYLARKGGK